MSGSTHSPAPTSGTLVAERYRLDELAGTGGMAQVWAATDTVLGRRVAVKLLHPHLRGDEATVARFRQEGVMAARLSHPSIVGVFDTASTPTAEAIIMELVDGRTLRSEIDEHGRLRPHEVVELGISVCDALEEAHRRGLIHRDIKPANILLCKDGGVKIADFGIAKGDADVELTRDGTLVGTATYLSPEQLTGAGVDGRSDVYSLALVLYEALCGRPPFTGTNEMARAMQRLHQTPVPAYRVVPGVPRRLSACLSRALEIDPDARPQSAGDFRAALADCLDATPTSLLRPPGELAPTPASASPAPDRSAPRPAARTTTRTTARRSAAAPARRSRTRRRDGRLRRHRLGTLVLVLLIGGALALIVALMTSAGAPTSTTSSTTSPGDSAQHVRAVAAFDPQGTGTPGENDGQAPLAIDGKADTSWKTESYNQQDFGGTKSGVGLVLTLDGTSRIDHVEVDSPSAGWSASVFVTTAPPDLTTLATRPAASLADISGTARFNTGANRGRYVLLWITRLSTVPSRFSVAVDEVRVVGRP